MARYEVRFDGNRCETFYDRDQACEWAQDVAATGRVVDVVQVRRLSPRRLVTAYPESEREAREVVWAQYNIGAWAGSGY